MRLSILSVGCNLKDSRVTETDFSEAPAFEDFDVLIVDPAHVWKNAFPDYRRDIVAGKQIMKWDAKGYNKILDLTLKQRRDETKRLLELNRLLICILREPRWAELEGVRDRYGKQRYANNYTWFPMEHDDQIASLFSPAEGTRIHLVDGRHTFAPYIAHFKEHLAYEAYLEEDKIPYYFERDGETGVEVFARTHGRRAVAFSFKLFGGTVVFIPPVAPTLSQKESVAGKLLECILATTGAIEETEPPCWLPRYRQLLPGLSDLEDELERREQQLKCLQDEVDALKQQKHERTNYLKLLYEKGKFQLQPVVRDAFSILGFDVSEAEPSDGRLESPEGTAILEVEGKDNAPVDRDKYRQLLDYVDDDQRRTGSLKKGILVGNAFRFQDPLAREEQFTPQAIDAARGSHFCLLSADALFRLVVIVLGDPSNENLKSDIRRRILETNGLFKLEDNWDWKEARNG